MPSSRVVVPGVAAHVTQRGVDRGPTFIADEDFACYRSALGEAARKARCRVHAYALMTNHVHLLVTPDDVEGLARLMQSLGRRYVHYFNHRYARTGTLWEGRFRSTLVASRSYFFACSRYIELNPVRAGLATSVEDYRWTSFRHNALHAVEHDAFLTPHEEYAALGADPDSRRAAYRSLFDRELDAEEVSRIRAALPGRPSTGEAYNRVVVATPRWAALRHHLHVDVTTQTAQ
jgi:putative transposase